MDRGGNVLMDREKLIQLRWLLNEWGKNDEDVQEMVRVIDYEISVLEARENN